MKDYIPKPRKAGLLACASLAFVGCASAPKAMTESKEAIAKLLLTTYIVVNATNYSGNTQEIYEELRKTADRNGDGSVSNEEATIILKATLEAKANNWEQPYLQDPSFDAANAGLAE